MSLMRIVGPGECLWKFEEYQLSCNSERGLKPLFCPTGMARLNVLFKDEHRHVVKSNKVDNIRAVKPTKVRITEKF